MAPWSTRSRELPCARAISGSKPKATKSPPQYQTDGAEVTNGGTDDRFVPSTGRGLAKRDRPQTAMLCPTTLFHRHVRALGLLARHMGDLFVEQAAQALEELHARVAEVVARGCAHQVFQHRHRGLAKEAASGVSVGSGSGVFLFHLMSPSFRRSVSYSPTWRARAKGSPSSSVSRCGAAGCRSRLPVRRPS